MVGCFMRGVGREGEELVGFGEEGAVGFYHSWHIGEGEGKIAFAGEGSESVIVGDLGGHHAVFLLFFSRMERADCLLVPTESNDWTNETDMEKTGKKL